jgi:hypothetical protein
MATKYRICAWLTLVVVVVNSYWLSINSERGATGIAKIFLSAGGSPTFQRSSEENPACFVYNLNRIFYAQIQFLLMCAFKLQN